MEMAVGSIGYDRALALLVGMFVPNARILSHPHHGLLDALTLCTLLYVQSDARGGTLNPTP